jgi:hypothetical protein
MDGKIPSGAKTSDFYKTNNIPDRFNNPGNYFYYQKLRKVQSFEILIETFGLFFIKPFLLSVSPIYILSISHETPLRKLRSIYSNF